MFKFMKHSSKFKTLSVILFLKDITVLNQLTDKTYKKKVPDF